MLKLPQGILSNELQFTGLSCELTVPYCIWEGSLWVQGVMDILTPYQGLIQTLSAPNPLADLQLQVDGYCFYFSKFLFANVCSKQCQPLLSCSAGKLSVILFPDGSLYALLLLLSWMLPSEAMEVTGDNVEPLLGLAVKYGISKLHDDCELYYEHQMQSPNSHGQAARYLALAPIFDLSRSFELAVSKLVPLMSCELEDCLIEIDADTRAIITDRRLKLFESGAMVDGSGKTPEYVTLVVDSGAEFEVMSGALMISPVFKTMLKSNFLEKGCGQIRLPGKSKEAVKFMVDFLTSPDSIAKLPSALLPECVGLAEEYMLGRMKEHCEEVMLQNVQKDNLNEGLLYLSLAQLYKLNKVKDSVLQTHKRASIHDMLHCKNYNLDSAVPLVFECIKVLEKDVRKLKRVKSRAKLLLNAIKTSSKRNMNSLKRATEMCYKLNTIFEKFEIPKIEKLIRSNLEAMKDIGDWLYELKNLFNSL